MLGVEGPEALARPLKRRSLLLEARLEQAEGSLGVVGARAAEARPGAAAAHLPARSFERRLGALEIAVGVVAYALELLAALAPLGRRGPRAGAWA